MLLLVLKFLMQVVYLDDVMILVTENFEMCRLFIYLSIYLLPCICLVGCDGSEAEKRLYRHLFKDYNPRIRPVVNDNETLEVSFGLTMSQLIDVVSN